MKKTLPWVIIGVFMCMFCGWGIKLNHEIKKLEYHHIVDNDYSYALDCVREAEIKYWGYKSDLVDEVQSYIDLIAPTSNLRGYAIVEECEKYNIDICFVLTQAEIESHFGTKGLGSKINNVFNVGVFDGKSISEIDKKYKPDHPNKSIRLYLELLTTNYLVGKVEEDLMQNYVDKNGSRYASNPDYEAMFSAKYKYICENTKIKEIQSILRSYAVKCNR